LIAVAAATTEGADKTNILDAITTVSIPLKSEIHVFSSLFFPPCQMTFHFPIKDFLHRASLLGKPHFQSKQEFK
jgi:hypothetical protein